jgi:hypothetical protein
MSETNVQLFPGVFRTTQGGSNPDFFLHSAGRVGIGNDAPDTPPAWNTNTTFKLNVTGHTHVNGNLDVTGYLYGDGSTLSGVAAVVGGYWDLDQANNNIKYDIGNVGIGGVASSTNILKVHGTVEATSFSGIQESDVPNISASKITTGTLGIDQIPTISTNKISGDFGAGGNIGINTTNPYRALDVQAPARPSIYPFAIGGAWSNRAEYVAKTWDPGIVDSLPYPSVNFVVGGQGKSGWARVMVGAWKPNDQNHGSLYVYSAAHFIFAVDGPMGIDAITIRDQKTGMGAGDITMTASGEYNGVKITITRTTGQGAGVPPVKWNVWYEIYHEDGVWWS